MLLDLLQLELGFQLISLLLLDRLWLGELGHSLLMRHLLVTALDRAARHMSDTWLETTLLLVLVLDPQEGFSRLDSHHRRLPVATTSRVILFEIVGHG